MTERQDYQGQIYVIEQNRLGIVVAKNEQLWDISLFARSRFGGEFSSGTPTRNVADIVGGVRFTFPINDLSRQQQLVQANTGYRSAELQLADIRAGVAERDGLRVSRGREQHYVESQLAFSFKRKRMMLEETEVTRGLVGRYVESYAYADDRLELRWKAPFPVLSGVRQGPVGDACGDHRQQAAR